MPNSVKQQLCIQKSKATQTFHLRCEIWTPSPCSGKWGWVTQSWGRLLLPLMNVNGEVDPFPLQGSMILEKESQTKWKMRCFLEDSNRVSMNKRSDPKLSYQIICFSCSIAEWLFGGLREMERGSKKGIKWFLNKTTEIRGQTLPLNSCVTLGSLSPWGWKSPGTWWKTALSSQGVQEEIKRHVKHPDTGGAHDGSHSYCCC